MSLSLKIHSGGVMRAGMLFSAVFLVVALAGCTHDTLQSIREDPLENGQFTSATSPDVVVRNMHAMYEKCWAQWYRPARMYTRISPPSGPGAATAVELHQNAPLGNRTLLVVEVRPLETGSEIAYYKSGGFHALNSVRPRLEKWAKGDDLTC